MYMKNTRFECLAKYIIEQIQEYVSTVGSWMCDRKGSQQYVLLAFGVSFRF